MRGWLVRGRIASFERDYDYDMSYARDMYDTSACAFFRFSKILGISSHRENVPIEAWYAARLAATRSEDCGPCTQLVVKLAEREGVSPAAIAAVLRDNRDAIPPTPRSDFALRRPSCVAPLPSQTVGGAGL